MLHKKRKPSTFTSSSGFTDCKRNATSNDNMLHSKSTYFYRWFPISCSLVFLLGLGIILNPAINSTEDAHAETVAASPTDYSSISLTISNNGTELNTGDTVSTNVEPGLVSYITNNLRIDTKKINRFYVSIQAAENGSSELTGIVNKATIAPVGSNKIPAATDENGFGDNTWGFALGEVNAANESMSYNSLPAYGTSTTPQYSSATNLADGTYNLKLIFAAKINANKPSDHYTTKAMVSVAADAKEIAKTWDTITRMDEMTSSICKAESVPVGSTKQLIDDRDGTTRSYWVAKLTDSNCWMTQNIDLDMDIAQNGVIKAANITNLAEWKTTDKVTNATAAYYDPKLYVYSNSNNPTEANACSSNTAGLSACTSNGWINVAGYTPYSTVDNGGKIVDSANKKYDAHYTIGNYYSWEAATNGTGSTATNASGENGMGAIASGSICPKGWKLPLAGSDCANGNCTHDNTSGSFRYLLTEYDFTFKYNGANAGGTSVNGTTSGADGTGQHISATPLYILRSGAINNGQIVGVGNLGNLWSSIAYSNTAAYDLSIRDNTMSPSDADTKHSGRSVRCVVK